LNTGEIVGSEGKLRPVHIAWREASGPVSPRYQFHARLDLTAGGKEVRIEFQRKKEGAAEESGSAKLSLELYQQLWDDLIRRDVFQHTADLVPAERRTGVSYNSFELRADGLGEVHFQYLLSRLDDPVNRSYREVIEVMRRLLDEVAPGGRYI
jgi:hypothetical protein